MVLLLICTCTYVRAAAPALVDRNKKGYVTHRSRSVFGVFFKAARIGTLACLPRRTTVALLLYSVPDHGHLHPHVAALVEDATRRSAIMSQDHPLHQACLDGHLSRVQELLHTDEGRASLTRADADGRQPLHWAVTSDEKREIVDALLGAGDVDVNAPDASGWTPLMIASSSGARRIVQTLLQRYVSCADARGADVHAGNHKHITALHYASSKNHADIVRELLEHGADVNALDGAKQRPMYVGATHPATAPLRLAMTRLCASCCARRRASMGRRMQRRVSSTSNVLTQPGACLLDHLADKHFADTAGRHDDMLVHGLRQHMIHELR